MKTCAILLACLLLYFLPGYIAAERRHNNATPIFITNLCFGWTGIGWLACLIWATSANTRRA